MISALMTVYNGGQYIKESITSILSQSYSTFELIIVNDGSTDSTERIIRSFKDSRIKLVTLHHNVGVGAAIIEGLKHVTGDIIAKVDADDIYCPDRFEVQSAYLNQNVSIDLVDSQIEYFTNSDVVAETSRYKHLKNVLEQQVNDILSGEDIEKYLYWFACITHSTIMFRTRLLSKVSYNPTLRIGEDYDFFYRLNKNKIKMGKIPKVLGKIRVSENSTTVVERHNLISNFIGIKEAEIRELCHSRQYIYIWGTGELGHQTYKYLMQEYSIDITAFIDSDSAKYSQLTMGKKVINLNEIDPNAGIVVASSVGKYEISKLLENKGLKHLTDYLVIL